MKHLACIRPCGEDRVITQKPGVAVGSAPLQTATDLPDETVDIDDQAIPTRTCARAPRPLERLPEQRVELTHMPERERPQERPQRRRRRAPATQQPPRTARPQHIAPVVERRLNTARETVLVPFVGGMMLAVLAGFARS
jgi:hypothetical protein